MHLAPTSGLHFHWEPTRATVHPDAPLHLTPFPHSLAPRSLLASVWHPLDRTIVGLGRMEQSDPDPRNLLEDPSCEPRPFVPAQEGNRIDRIEFQARVSQRSFPGFGGWRDGCFGSGSQKSASDPEGKGEGGFLLGTRSSYAHRARICTRDPPQIQGSIFQDRDREIEIVGWGRTRSDGFVLHGPPRRNSRAWEASVGHKSACERLAHTWKLEAGWKWTTTNCWAWEGTPRTTNYAKRTENWRSDATRYVWKDVERTGCATRSKAVELDRS